MPEDFAVKFAVFCILLFSATGFIIMLLLKVIDLIMEVMIKLDLLKEEMKNEFI